MGLAIAIREFMPQLSAATRNDPARELAQEWETFVTSQDAFVLASWVEGDKIEDSKAYKVYEKVASLAGLPTSPSNLRPQQVSKAVNASPYGVLYTKAAATIITLRSKAGSLKPCASGIRSWGLFCDSVGAPHSL